MLSFLKRYNGIMFTHDPKSAKVSKGFESPNLQGRVNSPRSSILIDTSPWTNDDPFLPSSKLSTWLSKERFGIGPLDWNRLGVTKIVLLGLKSIPVTSRFVVTKLTTDRLVNSLSCDGIDMVIKDGLGAKGYRCGVLQFFPVEEFEQETELNGIPVALMARKLLKTLSLVESRSPEFNLFSDLEEYSKEEVAETMTETMEQYMSKTRADYGSRIYRPKIDNKDYFELKGQFLKELRENTFSGSDHEDANEHIEKVLEIVDLFHILNITQDQVMLRAFPMSLTGVMSCWLRNKPSGSITT
ncbi:hypothetical protein Tco_1237344 [Tanacetum coccineum]